MEARTRAFLYNFLCFGFIFITVRLGVQFTFPDLGLLLTPFLAGIIALFLAPRFASFEKDGRDVVLMKWIFMKGVREV